MKFFTIKILIQQACSKSAQAYLQDKVDLLLRQSYCFPASASLYSSWWPSARDQSLWFNFRRVPPMTDRNSKLSYARFFRKGLTLESWGNLGKFSRDCRRQMLRLIISSFANCSKYVLSSSDSRSIVVSSRIRLSNYTKHTQGSIDWSQERKTRELSFHTGTSVMGSER